MKNKVTQCHSYMEGHIRYMSCQVCGRYEKVGDDAVGLKCSRCLFMTMNSKYPQEDKVYKPTGRPPGWHFMNEYVDKDGNVFHKGKEQPKLKGTLKPTLIKPPKKTKRRTKEQMLVAQYNKKKAAKKAALKKAVQKQKDFLNHNIKK